MGFKELVTGKKDKCKTIYFKEGYTFKTSDLNIKDGCLVYKENDVVLKGWGHSPKALLPLAGSDSMVQVVNARDGNVCDPFHLVDKSEVFTDTSIRTMAIEQHYKAVNIPPSTQMSKMQLLILVIATFLFFIGGVVFLIKNI